MVRIEKRAVLDTNVVLKMFFRESDSDKADQLLGRVDTGELQIVMPSFGLIEFVNALWLKVRHGRAMRPDCEAVLQRFLALADQMDVMPAEPLLNEVLSSSSRHDHSAVTSRSWYWPRRSASRLLQPTRCCIEKYRAVRN